MYRERKEPLVPKKMSACVCVRSTNTSGGSIGKHLLVGSKAMRVKVRLVDGTRVPSLVGWLRVFPTCRMTNVGAQPWFAHSREVVHFSFSPPFPLFFAFQARAIGFRWEKKKVSSKNEGLAA